MSMLCFISSLHSLAKIAIFVLVLTLASSTDVNNMYKTCTSQLFSCGSNDFSNIGYPFWGGGRPSFCGHPALRLHCELSQIINDSYPLISIEGEATYKVVSMNFTAFNVTLELQRINTRPCTRMIGDNIFEYTPRVDNITLLYNCSSDTDTRNFSRPVPCIMDHDVYQAYYVSNVTAQTGYFASSCSSTVVPVLRNELDRYNNGEVRTLTHLLERGFEVTYQYSKACISCNKSGGTCGSSSTDGSDFVCFCKNGKSKNVCRISVGAIAPAPSPGRSLASPLESSVPEKSRRLIIYIVSACLTAGICVLVLAIILCCRTKRGSIRKFAVFWRSEAANCRNVDAFLQIYGSFSITRYTYANIKKMTSGFSDRLGEGGFGTVYKGKLPSSDRHVAVKVLKQSKGDDGEDFLNEVASISRTNHVNVVSLLGFCYEGNKRALVYEFLSNGSLEKFTFHGSRDRIQSLPWETLFNIALGIARGLDYLHRGCNARILHLDIKPHNILLDDDFCPKISDFGLARLCPEQESTISMLEARGTIGYIAPEVFCRTIGGVSHKSDVYSFGMMVLDMVCGRKNLSADLQRSSDVYFPQWIYNRLELEEDAAFQGALNDEEKAVQRKMIIVSLWCVQTYPSNRPSMSRVVEMLQGCDESIQMPPNPNLASPLRGASDMSVTLAETCESET